MKSKLTSGQEDALRTGRTYSTVVILSLERQSLYCARVSTPIPDDDGYTRFSWWFFATSNNEAWRLANEHAKEANEGLVVHEIEREDVEETSP